MKRFMLLSLFLAISALAAPKAVDEFKRTITCYMIDEVVADFVEMVDDEECIEYVPLPGMMRDVGQKARQVVYCAELGDDWATQIYRALLTGKAYWDVAPHNKILNIARDALDTPEELWDVYTHHRSRAIGKIRHANVVDEAIAHLKRVLTYFEDSTSCVMEPADIYIYEWIARRRTEGGQALVDTWRRVIEDMREKLLRYCH